jgi:hypothetical protein
MRRPPRLPEALHSDDEDGDGDEGGWDGTYHILASWRGMDQGGWQRREVALVTGIAGQGGLISLLHRSLELTFEQTVHISLSVRASCNLDRLIPERF